MKAHNNLLQVLSPYGIWTHAKGKQLVDENAATSMVKNAEKFFAKEIPIYIGHPDENSRSCKNKRVGKVEKIFKTKRGIVVSAKYTDDIYKKIISKEISAMSPRWEMKKIKDDYFRPIRLISIGLTNNPNIKGSGEIVDIFYPRKDCNGATATVAFAKTFNRKCTTLTNRAKTAQAKLSKLASLIRKRNIKVRLDNLNSIQANDKQSFKNLSLQAKEISLKTGESYTKVFAKLKNNKQKNQK